MFGLKKVGIITIIVAILALPSCEEAGKVSKKLNGDKHLIKARNMEEATTHFKFFYPKKLLWKVSVKHGT